MESAPNGTTAYVSECRVNNYQVFRQDYDRDITCNGYVIAARKGPR